MALSLIWLFLVIVFIIVEISTLAYVSFWFIFGAVVGFVRIFQGRHFFTDVVFAFFFTWLTITLIYKFFYPNDELPDTIQKN